MKSLVASFVGAPRQLEDLVNCVWCVLATNSNELKILKTSNELILLL